MGAVLFSIILASILLCISIIILIITIVTKKIRIVEQNSEMLNKLHELNETTKLNNIKNFYTIKHQFDTQKEYDNTNINDYFEYEVSNNLNYYKNILDTIMQNRDLYHDYLIKYNALKSTATPEQIKPLKITHKFFKQIELSIFKKNRLTVINDAIFYCKLSYTSPQKKYYSKCKEYNIDYLELLIDKINDNDSNMQLEKE